jgi:hypothetical protein
MLAIKIDVDGTVGYFEGPQDFWMDEAIDWAEGSYPGEEGHAVYFDDNALFADVQVRTTLAGVDYPIPLWVVGVHGEDIVDATIDLDKVIADLGPRRYPLFD